MANPQPTDAHLRVAHSINEQLMVSHFSEQQRRILDLILRLSWGCGKKEANIPHQNDFAVVGVLKGHIKAHLDWLIEARVISRQDCYYQFNKDFDQWRVSRALAYTPRKLTELVTLNLNHTKPVLRNTERRSYGIRNKAVTEYGTDSDTKLASPKERLKKVLKKDIYIIPDFIDKDIWNDFLLMRNKIRKPATERAKELIVKDLEKFKAQGINPNDILIQSIKNSWTDVYPLKNDMKGGRYGLNKGHSRQLPERTDYAEPYQR